MKRLLKLFAAFLCALLVLPAVLVYRLAGLVVGKEKAFPGFSQAFSLLPGISGVYLRRAFYWWVLPRVGRDVWISFGTVLSHPTAEFGEKVYIGVGCMIGDATLEDDVLLGSHVSVINGNRQHGIERLDVPVREQPGEFPRVTIGRDTWIGDRAVVLADVGRHCVVGAGSVVTKPVPDYAIVVGNPARVIGFRGDGQPVEGRQEDRRQAERPDKLEGEAGEGVSGKVEDSSTAFQGRGLATSPAR